MGAAKRKVKEQAERVGRIVAAARQVAESDGWSAVTVRRLAEMIEYSQPVLYSHFENRDAIVAAVALDGFKEIAVALKRARRRAADDRSAIQHVALAYLDFARENPALYEAMFTMPTSLRFAQADTMPELRGAFAALAAVFPPSRNDVEVATETLWAALHGLATLEATSRIRRGAREERLALLVGCLSRR